MKWGLLREPGTWRKIRNEAERCYQHLRPLTDTVGKYDDGFPYSGNTDKQKATISTPAVCLLERNTV